MGNGHSVLFFFFFWLGRGLGPNLARLNGTCGTGEKNLVSKRAGFEPWDKTRGLGPSMEKPGPNPTHCHSYSLEPKVPKTKKDESTPLIIKSKKRATSIAMKSFLQRKREGGEQGNIATSRSPGGMSYLAVP